MPAATATGGRSCCRYPPAPVWPVADWTRRRGKAQAARPDSAAAAAYQRVLSRQHWRLLAVLGLAHRSRYWQRPPCWERGTLGSTATGVPQATGTATLDQCTESLGLGLLGNRSNATTTDCPSRSSRASPTWSTSSSIPPSSILTQHHHRYPRHPHPFLSPGSRDNPRLLLFWRSIDGVVASAHPDFDGYSLAGLT